MKIFKTGLIGTGITALCCFTPILVWGLAGLAGLGLGFATTIVPYLDYVLLPLLGLFLCLTLYGLWRAKSR